MILDYIKLVITLLLVKIVVFTVTIFTTFKVTTYFLDRIYNNYDSIKINSMSDSACATHGMLSNNYYYSSDYLIVK